MAKTPIQIDHRFRDIEILLLWEGQVGNARLRALYGIGIGAASLLLRAFRERFPGACEWHPVQRVYEVPASGLHPTLSAGAIAEYAELLAREGSNSGMPTVDARLDITQVSPQVFAALHRACKRRKGVDIEYMSMSNPTPASRTLFPHSLVQIGRRWHVRGFDLKSNEFRDFTLGRIVSVADQRGDAPTLTADADTAWHELVNLTVVPHPALSQSAANVIRHEYMRGAAARAITCRAALVHYVIQDLRIAVRDEQHQPPDYQLALAPGLDVSRWLFR